MLHRTRLWIVLGVTLVMAAGIGGLYAFRYREGQKSAALEAAAQRFLVAGDFASAKIEVEKLLLLSPEDAQYLFLRARAELGSRDPGKVQITDVEGVAGIRSLILAARRDPGLTDAQAMLVRYFLGAGDISEAAPRAKAVLRRDPKNLDARYALSAWQIEQGQIQDAATNLGYLVENESPVRPRTARLLARLSDLSSKDSEKQSAASGACEVLFEKNLSDFEPVDRLAMVDLRIWKAAASTNPKEISGHLTAATAVLAEVVASEAFAELPARDVLGAAQRLLPEEHKNRPLLASALRALEPKVQSIIEGVFGKTIAAGGVDPQIYLDYANRLRAQGSADKAVATVQRGIERSKELGPEARRGFAVCDLWLAEHFLALKQPDSAAPHVEALLAHETMRPFGQLLLGHQKLQDGQTDVACECLAEAAARLPKHGTANALYGLALLRRGFITEGRQYLERGIGLGAAEPQYKAWLALALAEAGYQEQAMALAREILASPAEKSLGRAVLGQLRLRAGQWDDAERDFALAAEGASAEVRGSLELSRAEVSIARGDWPAAKRILDSLKQGPTAPQAFALEHRYLLRNRLVDQADETLAAGRKAHPDDLLLAGLEARRLVEKKNFAAAAALAEELGSRQPQALLPILLASEIADLSGDAPRALDVLRAACQARPEEVALRIRFADRLLAEREFAEAERTIERLKGDPKVNPSTLDYLLARLEWMRGEPAKAEEILRRAAARDPDNSTLKFLLGQLAASRGDYASAAGLFQQSLSRTFSESAAAALFDALLRTGEISRAADILHQAQRHGLAVGPLRTKMIRILAQKEQWEPLEKEVVRLLEGDPSEEEWALGVSMLRFARRSDKAAHWLDRGLARFPKSAVLGEQKAAMLLDQKQIEPAEKLLAELIAAHPDDAGIHLVKTQMLLERKDVDQALAAAREGYARCPGNRALEALVVQILLRKNLATEAIEFAAKEKAAHPDLPNAKYLAARMLESLGRADEAMALLAGALAEEPTSAAIANHYVRHMIRRNQVDGLEETIDRLLRANPDNPLLQGVLAELYAGKSDLSKAQELIHRLEGRERTGPLVAYLRAVLAASRRDYTLAESLLVASQADPRGHVPGTLLLAQIRREQNRPREALELAERICRQRPTLESAQVLRSKLLWQLGRLAEGESAAREFLTNQPDSRPGRVALAQNLAAQNDSAKKSESIRLVEAALAEAKPTENDFEACVLILYAAGAKERAWSLVERQIAEGTDLALPGGRACYNAADYPRAKEAARAILARRDDDAEARLLLADALARIGEEEKSPPRIEEAVEQYREILRRRPGHLAAANNLAWTQGVRLNRPHRALEELAMAVPAARTPNRQLPPEVLDTIGTLHLLMDHPSDAQQYLEAAATLAPNNAAIHFHLGQVYRRLRRPEQAAHSFEQAKKLDPRGEWTRRIEEEAPLAN